MDKIRVGYIGFGRRGIGILKGCVLEMADVEVVAVCDVWEDHCKLAVEAAIKKERKKPAIYTDYNLMLKECVLDAVFVMTGWNDRVRCAIKVMEAGVPVAIEVGLCI